MAEGSRPNIASPDSAATVVSAIFSAESSGENGMRVYPAGGNAPPLSYSKIAVWPLLLIAKTAPSRNAWPSLTNKVTGRGSCSTVGV